ncbi:MAG: hypothetical protein L7W43_13180 [Rubripirellula sp.]|nr:hypothetical protein [Rubripirellula sp.]
MLEAPVTDGEICTLGDGSVLDWLPMSICDVDPAGSLSGCSDSESALPGLVGRFADSSGFESLQPASDSVASDSVASDRVTSDRDIDNVSENSRAKLFPSCQNGVRAHMG